MKSNEMNENNSFVYNILIKKLLLLFFGLFEESGHASVHVRLPISKLDSAEIFQRDGHAVFQVITSALAEYIIRNLFLLNRKGTKTKQKIR
jgi:hypothetical protein